VREFTEHLGASGLGPAELPRERTCGNGPNFKWDSRFRSSIEHGFGGTCAARMPLAGSKVGAKAGNVCILQHCELSH
jgi:hypothetical protein